jgi:hypothetical protein
MKRFTYTEDDKRLKNFKQLSPLPHPVAVAVSQLHVLAVLLFLLSFLVTCSLAIAIHALSRHQEIAPLMMGMKVLPKHLDLTAISQLLGLDWSFRYFHHLHFPRPMRWVHSQMKH